MGILHPQYDSRRLSNDIAILRLNRRVNLNHRYVNTACLPSCGDQFSYTFNNGTGVRCHVAGWGKDEFTGNFQFIQHKVDIPLMDDFRCNAALQLALNRRQQGVGNRFQLHSSEVCAGGDVGKDACTGDGGSPLVCQAQSDAGPWWGSSPGASAAAPTRPGSTPRSPASTAGLMPTRRRLQCRLFKYLYQSVP